MLPPSLFAFDSTSFCSNINSNGSLIHNVSPLLYTLPTCFTSWNIFFRQKEILGNSIEKEELEQDSSQPPTWKLLGSRSTLSSLFNSETSSNQEPGSSSVPAGALPSISAAVPVPVSASASASPPNRNASPSSSSSPPRRTRLRDPHTTEWGDVDIWKFAAWMSFFSTIENAVFYPFWVLKTREQADRSRDYRALAYAKNQLSLILRTQGVKGLYKGFITSSIVTLPAYGVYMGVYTWTKEKLGYRAGENSDSLTAVGAPFLAGIIADAASVILYVPGDVVVQRLQLQNTPYRSAFDACTKIAKEEGINGFYKGLGATFLTSAVASAIWWAVYENSKRELYRRTGVEKEKETVSNEPDSAWNAITGVNRWPQLMAGFIAGTVTSTLVNPLDVVKTRLQVQDSHSTPVALLTAPPSKYVSVWHGLKMVYADEGIKGYFRGVLPKLVSRGPLSAMSSLLYELVLYLARKEEIGGETPISATSLT